MCGITGWIDFARDLRNEAPIVDTMTDTLARRGPDARGVWLDTHAALGHRRLSIIDPERGAQPMLTPERGPRGRARAGGGRPGGARPAARRPNPPSGGAARGSPTSLSTTQPATARQATAGSDSISIAVRPRP